MAITIKVLQGDDAQAGKELTLDKTTVLIGRGAEQDVRIDNDSVSRRHCVIEKREGQWRIIDEDSHNGIYVNGQRVQKTRVIKHEDVIEIGEAMFRVGLDRKMREETAGGKASLPVIVRSISAVTIMIMLCMAGSALFLLHLYKQRMDSLTATIPVALGQPETRTAFEQTADQCTFSFSVLPNMPGWIPFLNVNYVNPVPEWDYDTSIWTSQQAGAGPRLFDGMDLDLPGGEQVVCSGYFFCRRGYQVRDVSDPVGMLFIEIEGWSGLGERYANEKTIPALRAPELPHFVKTVEIYPDKIQDTTHSGWDGVQTALFSFMTPLMNPPSGNSPLAPPPSESIITKLLPPRKSGKIQGIGKYTSFFKDGNRFTVTVRGTQNLLDRFQGKLEALSDAVVNSVKIEPPAKRPPLPTPESLQKKVKEKGIVLIAASRKPMTVDAITYHDLLEVRNILLTMQQSPQPMPGEEELRRQYFMVRNKVQKDLLVSAFNIAQARLSVKSAEGERELKRIREFMAGDPPVTMQRGDPGYPEWIWYFEDVVDGSTPVYAKFKYREKAARRTPK